MDAFCEASFCLFPLVDSLGKPQVRLRQPKCVSEPLGAPTGKQRMIGSLHYKSRQTYRVLGTPKKSNSRASSSLPIHDSGIGLNISGKIQGGPAACIEDWVILHFQNRRLNGLNRGISLLKEPETSVCCLSDARQSSCLLRSGPVPSAAMNDDCRTYQIVSRRRHVNEI